MSIENVHYVNMMLGAGATVLFLLSLLALVLVLCKVKENKYLSLIKNNFLLIGFLISLSAILTSLFYSEVLNYAPCFLCWIDRVVIFPQAVIFGVALARKDKNAFWYSVILTSLGIINSVYHIFEYYFAGEGVGPCDASGVSCVQRLVSEFGGYISIPTLAFIGFFALATLLIVVRLYKNEN